MGREGRPGSRRQCPRPAAAPVKGWGWKKRAGTQCSRHILDKDKTDREESVAAFRSLK